MSFLGCSVKLIKDRPLLQKLKNIFYHLPQAFIANILYGFPSNGMTIVGVTGTDGKTTTTNLIYKILKDSGKKVSMISTINAVIGGKTYDTGFHVTSPDPFTLQKFIRNAKNSGDNYLALEVTSHALDQYRFWGINFTVGVITNITHEHLDYHQTFENYFKTKLKLIKYAKWRVVNENLKGDWGDRGSKGNGVVTFGSSGPKLNLKLIGDYNLENAYASLAVAKVLGIDAESAQRSVEGFTGIPGRMEEVKNNRGIKIFVDFAHTPNALKQALKALRPKAYGRLIVVFGAASERDILKRPIMGEIAAKEADMTILTDEDPRHEDRNKILNEIAGGAMMAGAKDGINLFKEPDRAKAIKLAITLAKKGDIIGIFGKGHEKSINYRGVETPWSDFEAVKKALTNRH
ncbi:UDP-N-acetylmuramoyl-L-alanyl-D-glutamate--2,6-diaminopimelate ligase [Candidatus Daviesbacteria bacterium]|nr:UDP-N-acetylmuramoyl-L-alanyl-D-glutamate--2,6-diaminopimelate ligase [Candidatus Daviesbacteria bacterium]